MAAVPAPKDGRDGVDADPEAIAATVLAKVAVVLDAIPVPKDGAAGKDGLNADPEPIRLELLDHVNKFLAEIPAPKDGVQGIEGPRGPAPEPEVIRAMVVAAVAELPPARDGKDGAAGRDADPAEGAPRSAAIEDGS